MTNHGETRNRYFYAPDNKRSSTASVFDRTGAFGTMCFEIPLDVAERIVEALNRDEVRRQMARYTDRMMKRRLAR
jgi:hypothetical protein